MRITGKFRITEVNAGDDVNFVSASDIDEGGIVKFMMPSTIEVQNDQLVQLDATVKPSMGKYGLNLKIQKINKEGSAKQ